MEPFLERLEESLSGYKRYKRQATNLRVYAEFLISSNLPPILDLSYLAQFVDLDVGFLSKAIAAPHKFYRSYELPKRSGGMRLIDAPIPRLLTCQKWILRNLLETVPLHPCATGYRKDYSLLRNIEPHIGQCHLLKLDIENFFHSIKIRRVIPIFQKMGYLNKTAFELSSLCCVRGRLPQGSATSPTLSNIVAKRLDYRLNGLAEKHGLNYTRYADDITFSGTKIPAWYASEAQRIVADEGFPVNARKCRHYTRPGRRIVTGVSVAGPNPKIPRNTKRKLKQEVYEILSSTDPSQVFGEGGRDVFFLDSIRGKLEFWKLIEPESEYPKLALERLKPLFKTST